jgi:hypothetical protein
MEAKEEVAVPEAIVLTLHTQLLEEQLTKLQSVPVETHVEFLQLTQL